MDREKLRKKLADDPDFAAMFSDEIMEGYTDHFINVAQKHGFSISRDAVRSMDIDHLNIRDYVGNYKK